MEIFGRTLKALLCVFALLPAVASAMSGRDYLQHCRTATVYDRAHCMGYLDAVLRHDAGEDFSNDTSRADRLLDVAAPPKVIAYCLPRGISLPLLRDVVVRMLGQLPAQRLNGDAGVLIRGVLRRTYPPQAACVD